jgi:hypothetical protein
MALVTIFRDLESLEAELEMEEAHQEAMKTLGGCTPVRLVVLEAGATRKPLRITAVSKSCTAFAEISIAFSEIQQGWCTRHQPLAEDAQCSP